LLWLDLRLDDGDLLSLRFLLFFDACRFRTFFGHRDDVVLLFFGDAGGIGFWLVLRGATTVPEFAVLGITALDLRLDLPPEKVVAGEDHEEHS